MSFGESFGRLLIPELLLQQLHALLPGLVAGGGGLEAIGQELRVAATVEDVADLVFSGIPGSSVASGDCLESLLGHGDLLQMLRQLLED